MIVEATLHLKENIMLERKYEDMDMHLYGSWFRDHIRDNRDIIFHNADIYPTHYSKVRATSWEKSDKIPDSPLRLIEKGKDYPIHRGAYALMTYFRI